MSQTPSPESIDPGDVPASQAGSDETVAMTASLLRAIERDPNPQGRWKGAYLSEGGDEIGVESADGMRTFVITVREV